MGRPLTMLLPQLARIASGKVLGQPAWLKVAAVAKLRMSMCALRISTKSFCTTGCCPRLGASWVMGLVMLNVQVLAKSCLARCWRKYSWVLLSKTSCSTAAGATGNFHLAFRCIHADTSVKSQRSDVAQLVKAMGRPKAASHSPSYF